MAERGAELYSEWHWGIPHTSVQDWQDETVDGMLGPDGLVMVTMA